MGVVSLCATALAQAPEHAGEIEGVVRDAETGGPLAGSIVSLVGSSTVAVTHSDGSFHLTGIDEGVHAVRVERLGYRGRTLEIIVGADEGFVEIELVASPIALQGLVVTASLTARGAAEVLRPVSVVAGDELQRRMRGTVAQTLASVPGLAATGMGPATSRPVIRGLSGDRVLMLEDGSRIGDASSSGPDHATAVDPSSARRIEVVRGPAALLYGSNALGGVINVIRDEIPSAIPHHTTGSAALQSQTVSGVFAGNATTNFALTDRVPLRLELSGRTAGDLQTPLGSLANTSADTWNTGIGTGFVGEWGHLGGSFRGYRNRYGIPGGFVGGHEEGVLIEMDRMASKVKAVVEDRAGPFNSVKVDGAYTWYRHTEIEPPDIVGTVYKLETLSGDVLAGHDAWGPFAGGAVGARASRENLINGDGTAISHTPDSHRSTVAGFLFEEIDMGSLRIEAGLRYDWVQINPLNADPDSDIGVIRDRTFHAASGSLGILYRAESGMTMGASVARAFRTPDVSELFSEGPHLAAYTFEVGNPSLETEQGTGIDIFLRYESPHLRAEITGFYNDIASYIYGEETGRLSRILLPIYQFQSGDALLTGFEGSLHWDLEGGLALEGVASSVKGTLKDSNEPIPLIPPVRGRVSLEYERPRWFVGGEAEMAGRQDRIGAFESPTDGYTVFNANAGARITVSGRLNVLTLSLDNATNREYRNHLSRVKEIMPEAGRGLSVTYRVVF